MEKRRFNVTVFDKTISDQPLRSPDLDAQMTFDTFIKWLQNCTDKCDIHVFCYALEADMDTGEFFNPETGDVHDDF